MTMFRTYDIRGVYGKEVTPEAFFALGKTFDKMSKNLVVGVDYRKNNDLLASALLQGYSGDSVFMGVAPTPAIAFNSVELGCAITASHNPAEYNGLKPLKLKRCFYSEELAELKKEYEKNFKADVKVKAKTLTPDSSLSENYAKTLPEFGNAVFDLSGGAVCAMANIFPKAIFSQPDPLFIRHSPEPTPNALGTLVNETRKANSLGFAFDGDGDRCIAVDSGKLVDSGVATAFYAVNFLKKNSKIVLTLDVQDEILLFLEDQGFNVEYSPVGDVFVLKKAQERNADFAAEKSGHYYLLEHMPYSDGMYFSAQMSQSKAGDLNEFSRQFKSVFLSENLDNVTLDFAKLEEKVRDANPSRVETMDGVKARFEDYSILIRSSNTQPLVRVSIEAKNGEKGLRGLMVAKQLVMQCKR